jgi:ribonucleoside-diphosphate reductase alpha chain
MSETRERYWWKNTESQQILNRGYLLQGESVEGAIDRVCSAAAKNLFRPELKEAFKEMVERGWMSLSSPIWANMGTEGGLQITCFNVHVPDRNEDITHKLGEVIMQTKIGGGTSGYFGSLRERGSAVKDNGKSSGAVSFMKLFDTTMDTISQGGVRRGAFAAYLDIDHPDIEEFLAIKSIGSPIQNLFYAVCVPDYWLNEMIEGDMDKRKIWAKVLENRQQKGLPYIFFTDNINRNKPQVYKDKNMMINASNLCSEIALPSSKDESFICCLSSLNLEMYDEWKDTETVKLAVYFLDAALSQNPCWKATFGR